MKTESVLTERIAIHGGTELRVSLWRNADQEPVALVLTKAWQDDPVRFTHRRDGQVSVPGEALDDVLEALTKLRDRIEP